MSFFTTSSQLMTARGWLVCALLSLSAMVPLPLHAVETVRCQLANGFDYPVGKPDAVGYYKARGFWPNGHLGEDWNGVGGGDSDLGDPIYSMGHGVVVLSEDVRVGWGNVVIIRHAYREPNGKIEMVDSLYGHLEERKVKVGQIVERGQLVGTMGGNRGMYPVHLHFEIRKNLAIGMNRSKFARDYSNYHSPTPFISSRRQLPSDFKKYDIPVNTFAAYGGELSDTQSAYDTPAPNLPSGSGANGVRRTGRGLSIPVTGGSYSPGNQSRTQPSGRPAPGGSSTGISPPPSNATGSQEDFWSRLKSKLNNGQVTPGINEKK